MSRKMFLIGFLAHPAIAICIGRALFGRLMNVITDRRDLTDRMTRRRDCLGLVKRLETQSQLIFVIAAGRKLGAWLAPQLASGS